LEKRLRDEGVTLLLGGQATRLEKENGERILVFEPTAGGEPRRIPVDAILAGVGRAPNIGRLDLDAAGVAFDSKRGVHIDDTLRTTNRAVYAAGDVAMGWKFTHAADAAARLLIQNALFGGRKKLSGLNMPWCTYTNPEIAHIGLYERDAREKGIALDTYAAPLAEVDRAIADGQTEGFVRIHTKKGSSKILGATVVAADAGAMISEISVAMQSKNGLAAIAKAIHPYPTQSEALKRAGDDYTRSRLKSWMKPLIQAWLRVAR
jgi:pyruvate/2-oxoglutarate dehydrogenase complex dihydrolipoamide dehydrogenase (E3) component